jgi:hypothetical protein
MLNLYWKSDGQTRSLVERPFASENELERYVLANQDILGADVFIVYRQVRSGSRQGIPDMIGVDQDARVCIIELKNVEADEAILPQALGYAMWAETNPDSIKAIWLESKDRPEEIEIDWDNVDVRVILIAPSFKETVPRMASKIGYDIDLVRIRRYGFEGDEFLLVETIETAPGHRPGVTKAAREWDWDYYESEHGKEAAAQFRQAVQAIDALVRHEGWDLRYNLNKSYTGFKLGNKVVFAVHWGGTHAWNVEIRVPETEARAFSGASWEFQRYSDNFHIALMRPLRPDDPNIDELRPLLASAYRHVSRE